MGCFDLIADGGYEGGSPSAVWIEASSYFNTPICDVTCGAANQFAGAWWAWFGGVEETDEESSVGQTVTIPASATSLTFMLRMALCG